MMYVVTSRSARLIRDLLGLARELDGDALARTSVLARAEWNELLLRLPTEEDLRRGLVALAEDELGWLLAKAIRFREIIANDPANDRANDRANDPANDLATDLATVDSRPLPPAPRRSAHDSTPGL